MNYLYQTIPGSPIRVRTSGEEQPDISPDWEGYSSGTPSNINLVDEFRSPTLLPNGETYDSLVITERHDILGTIEWENTTSLLRHFHDRLSEGSANGRTYFYNSWLGIDYSDPQTWIEYEKASLMTWECVASKVNLTLADEGLPANITTIATGWAFAHLVEAVLNGEVPGVSGTPSQMLDTIFSDDVHPTELGDLFVGAFTFGEIFGQTPEGSSIPEGINLATGEYLLELAWSLVQQYHNRDDGGSHSMAACRTHIVDYICEDFHTYFSDNAQHVPGCLNYYGSNTNSNPFRWPDPNLDHWPIP